MIKILKFTLKKKYMRSLKSFFSNEFDINFCSKEKEKEKETERSNNAHIF